METINEPKYLAEKIQRLTHEDIHDMFGTNVKDIIEGLNSLRWKKYAKVTAPKLKSLTPTVQEAAQYASDLQSLPDREAEYKENTRRSNANNEAIDGLLKSVISDHAGLNRTPADMQEKLWNLAWDDAHSDGYYAVYQKLENIIDKLYPI